MRACIGAKHGILKVQNGLLDVIDRTAARLMVEPEVKEAGTQSEDLLLELCRMVLHANGFGHVLFLIDQEGSQQTSLYPTKDLQGEMDSETYHSVAHLLPAAIYLKLSSMIDRLLEGSPDLNVSSMYFWSPLCAAAFTGQVVLAQRLLDNGANAYYLPSSLPPKDAKSLWAFITQRRLVFAGSAAVIRGHDTILQMFLQTQDPSIVPEFILKSFLTAAVRGGHIEAIQTIHRHVPSLQHQPEMNEFIMYEACALDHMSIVHAMLQAGASVHAFTIYPYESRALNPRALNPLKVAASFGRLSTVKLLLAYGTPVNRALGCQYPRPHITALALAARYGYMQVTELLVERGADVDAGQLTPLNRACTYGQAHIVRFLLERGCGLDDEVRDDGQNPNPERPWDHVKLAIMNGRPSVAGVLKEFEVPGSLE